MTPKEQTIAQLFQISLFKWADTTQDLIQKLRENGSTQDLTRLSKEVEETVDTILLQYKAENTDMELVTRINGKVAEIKAQIRRL